jgi:hypothetical protein
LFPIVTPRGPNRILILKYHTITVGYHHGISIAVQKTVSIQKANFIHLNSFAAEIEQLFNPRTHPPNVILTDLEEK